MKCMIRNAAKLPLSNQQNISYSRSKISDPNSISNLFQPEITSTTCFPRTETQFKQITTLMKGNRDLPIMTKSLWCKGVCDWNRRGELNWNRFTSWDVAKQMNSRRRKMGRNRRMVGGGMNVARKRVENGLAANVTSSGESSAKNGSWQSAKAGRDSRRRKIVENGSWQSKMGRRKWEGWSGGRRKWVGKWQMNSFLE